MFAKGYIQNLSELDFVIKAITNTVMWNYVIKDLNFVEIAEIFYK